MYMANDSSQVIREEESNLDLSLEFKLFILNLFSILSNWSKLYFCVFDSNLTADSP